MCIRDRGTTWALCQRARGAVGGWECGADCTSRRGVAAVGVARAAPSAVGAGGPPALPPRAAAAAAPPGAAP
eukprot:15461055-Alexandrium_andersonii.AAC.1